RERGRFRRIERVEAREGAEALALRPRFLERPRERGERAADGPAGDVVGGEHAADVVPERARLARCPFVRRRLADAVQAAAGAGTSRVEEVALAIDGACPEQPAAQAAPRRVVEEGRLPLAPRQRSFLEAEQEDDVESARPRAREVEDGDAAGLTGACAGDEG